MASSCTYYVPKCGSTRLCDQNCGVEPADRQTQRHTDTGTDKGLKTEGPKILSNDIFYFRTMIIGGPIRTYVKFHFLSLFGPKSRLMGSKNLLPFIFGRIDP